MIFELDGQTWDTDKPVFVVGHNIFENRESWYAYTKRQIWDDNKKTYQSEGLACKKMWIKEIHLKNKNGVISVCDITFAPPKDERATQRFSNCFASNKRVTAVADFLNSLKK